MCTHTQSKATPLRTAPHEYPLASYTPQHAVHQRLLHQDTFSALPSKFMSACVILVLGMHVRPCLPIHKKATSHHPVCNPLTFCLVPQVHRVIAFHELVAHYGGLCVTAFSEHVTHVVIGVRGCCVCVCVYPLSYHFSHDVPMPTLCTGHGPTRGATVHTAPEQVHEAVAQVAEQLVVESAGAVCAG